MKEKGRKDFSCRRRKTGRKDIIPTNISFPALPFSSLKLAQSSTMSENASEEIS